MILPFVFFKRLSLCFAAIVVPLTGLPYAFAHSGTEIQIMKGQALELDLMELCKSELPSCENMALGVTTEPVEGFIFTRADSDLVRYQHAGTSTVDDSFVFTASDNKTSQSVKISFVVSAETPVLSIISPRPGATLKPGDVEVTFSVEGNGADHLHLALLDGEHVSVALEDGRYTFTNVKPGTYNLTASLATASHNTIYKSEVSIPIEIKN